MAYSLHIEIEDDEIDIDEWLAAVSGTPGARIDTDAATVMNPETGKEITIAAGSGDVSVLIDSEWVKCIFFTDGRATFNAVAGIENPSNAVHIVVAKIAGALGGTIVGDEGEFYEWSPM